MSPILSNGRKNERGIYRNNPRRKYNRMLTVFYWVTVIGDLYLMYMNYIYKYKNKYF